MNVIKLNRNPLFTDLMEDFFATAPFSGYKNQGGSPAANIKETDLAYEIEFAVPGLKKEDFKIGLENNVLTVSYQKEEKNEESNEKYTRREFMMRSFSRSFTLPKTVEMDKIGASYTDGLLIINIPKKAEENMKFSKEISIN